MKTNFLNYLGVILGIALLFVIFRFKDTKSYSQEKNPSYNLIGRKFDTKNLLLINGNSHSETILDQKVFILVSPNCPHCKKVLKLISALPEDEKITFVPIFKPISTKLLLNILHNEQIECPVYMMKPNEVMRMVKAVPTFIHINKQGFIDNSTIGGVLDKKELQELVETLVTEKWKNSTTSTKESACSS